MNMWDRLPKYYDKISLVDRRLLRRKPRFLVRYLIRATYNRFAGSDPVNITSVLFHVHYRCNLRCQHCYEKRFRNSRGVPLTLEEKKKIIGDCLELGALAFDFVSGESALDPSLPDIIRSCRPKKTYITIATNGYKLSEDSIRYFYDLGVDKLNISLDSWDPQIHNRIRGKKDAFDNVFETIGHCRTVGMGYQLTVFVSKHSTRSSGFKKLVEYAVRNRIRTTFKTAVPLGEWEGNYDGLIAQSDRSILYSLHKKYPFLIRTCVGKQDSCCPGLTRIVTITANGEVLPCNAVPISFGNARNERLRDIIQKGRHVDYFNGTYIGCPSSDDIDFIQRYLTKTYGNNPFPGDARKIFKTFLRSSSHDRSE